MLNKKKKENKSTNKKLKKESNEFHLEDLDTTFNLSNEERIFDLKAINLNSDKINIDEPKSLYDSIFIENFYLNNEISIRKFSNDENLEKKFKTEICKNYEIKGYCDFGIKCSFAHGSNELRSKINENNWYKTKNCLSFENGYCPYGNRCQYIHSETNYKSILDNYIFRINSYIEINKNENLFDLISKTIKVNHKRLNIFKKITFY